MQHGVTEHIVFATMHARVQQAPDSQDAFKTQGGLSLLKACKPHTVGLEQKPTGTVVSSSEGSPTAITSKVP